MGKGVCISPAVHGLEHTVGMVLFLLHDLVPEKLVISKDMVSCRSRDGDEKNSFKNHFLPGPHFIHAVDFAFSNFLSIYSFI